MLLNKCCIIIDSPKSLLTFLDQVKKFITMMINNYIKHYFNEVALILFAIIDLFLVYTIRHCVSQERIKLYEYLIYALLRQYNNKQ